MNKFGMKGKLVISFLGAGLVPLIIVGLYSFRKTTESLEKEVHDKLITVREIKGSAIKGYFKTIKNQVLSLSKSTMIQDAMVDFKESFNSFNVENELSASDISSYKESLKKFYQGEFGKKYQEENGKSANSLSFLDQLTDTQIALQYYYIFENSNPLGSKEVLDFASDKSNYSKLHKKYHPSIRTFLEKFGYYDIFLVDNKTGEIVYSVFKELDYTTSLNNGPFRNTNFAEAFKKAQGLSQTDEFAIVDYKKYTPSYDAPASFIATPIWKNDQKVGVLIFQMPIDRLNTVMLERAGMGETGETYLFGTDQLMRSDSHLDKENLNVVTSFKNPEKGQISSESVAMALEGKSGSSSTLNYLGNKVISAFAPIDILGLKWGLVAEVSELEAFAPLRSLEIAFYIIFTLSFLGIGFLAFYVANSFTKKLTIIAELLSNSAQRVANSSQSISVSSSNLSNAAIKQSSSLQETVSSIDEISSMVQRNADAAGTSAEVSFKSNEAALRGKKTVESMITSINDIAEGNNEIANEMQRNNGEISKIVNVISEIGDKTRVINDIVFQTKLLSFNASVEAARAGEHGKGFAVVAEEVGNLASMSGKAALEITEMLDSSIKQVSDIVESAKRKVEGLVSESKGKVADGIKTATECEDSLNEILKNVESVNEMVKEIASASSEQSTGVQEVTKAMQLLDQTTHQNTSVAKESSEMSRNLHEQADELNAAVKDLMEVIGVKNKNSGRSKDRSEKYAEVVALNVKQKKPDEVGHLKATGSDNRTLTLDESQFEDL
jgi:methyl-accepting chemotaxis protein